MKTTQLIVRDLESTEQHIRRGNLQRYLYKHCTDLCLTQIHTCTCTSCWTRNTDGAFGAFVVQWATVSRWPYETCKTKDIYDAESCIKRKNTTTTTRSITPTTIFRSGCKTRVAKWYRIGWYCFAGNEGDKSDNNTFDNDSDSDSDDEVYTWSMKHWTRYMISVFLRIINHYILYCQELFNIVICQVSS